MREVLCDMGCIFLLRVYPSTLNLPLSIYEV